MLCGVAARSLPSVPQEPKNTECRFYQNPWCRNGDYWRFLHGGLKGEELAEAVGAKSAAESQRLSEVLPAYTMVPQMLVLLEVSIVASSVGQ